MFGEYTVEVIYCDKFLEEFLFKVKIGFLLGEFIDIIDSGVKVYGLGLKNGIVDKFVVFIVDVRNVKYFGVIGVGIEGFKEVIIDIK